MPILPLETFLYPANLLDLDAADTHERTGQWWVLHTRPRAEKSLARRLHSMRHSFFLPQHQHRWRSNGRSFESHNPLFPGYLFLHGDDDARVAALTTNLVANFLPVGDQTRLQQDLVRVHQLMISGAPLTPEQNLIPGDPVEIIKGPFAGMNGTVIRRGKAWRLFVEVKFLQRGVSVEIEHWMIRPLASRLVSA
jgi:transcriptional antiterminator RfaH